MTDNDPNDDRTDIEKAFGRIAGRFGDAFNKLSQPAGAGNDNTATPEQRALAETDAFFKAVKRGRADDVQKFIDAGFDVNTHGPGGDTALHVAARNNLGAVAELLLRNGANPKLGKRETPGHTALDDAVNFGKHEIVELLTRYGGYVPGNTVNGYTLLHRACEKGKVRIVEALIRAGANGNELTQNGSTPLLIAISLRQAEVAETLLNFPAVIQGVNEFHAASDPKKRNAFQMAVERGQAGIVRRMLSYGSHVNAADAEGLSPLHHAILQNNTELVKTLLAAGADLNKSEKGQPTPLFLACQTGDIPDAADRTRIVSLLLKAGADPDAQDAATKQTPLHALLLQPNGAEAARVLLQYPLNKDAADKDGASPLYIALRKPAPDLLALMLAAGADPNARHMKDAGTPLIEAVKADNTVAVRLLLEKGANPRLFDASHKSALSYARESGNSMIILMLEESLKTAAQKQKRRPAAFKEFDL